MSRIFRSHLSLNGPSKCIPSLTFLRNIGSSSSNRQQSATKPQDHVEDEVLKMPAYDMEPEPYKGLTDSEVVSIRAANLGPSLTHYYSRPLHVHRGSMQWLWDTSGKRYLDFFGGIVTVSVGHCHPKVNDALRNQIDRLWHTTAIYLYPQIHEYARRLTDTMPGNLKVCYFVNSGSEANDMAMMMARVYTGNYDILALRNAYHGMSPYTMGLTAHSTWRYDLPANLGIVHSMNPDPYRGPWGGGHCRDSPVQADRSCGCPPNGCMAGDNYVEQIEDVLRHSVAKKGVAGFFAESIQGVGGSVQFPKNFLKRAFEAVRRRGGLCISDEVQTGFGRTGTHFWGFQGHDVIPDIVTMAKGIGNGFPLAAVVTTPEVAAVMGTALHFNTYGGNPMASAVGTAVLDVMEEEGTQHNSHVVGTALLKGLDELRSEFPLIGDVRGKGLMIGVEMVDDRESKKPLPADQMMSIWEECREMGLLLGKGGYYGNVFRIKPPMCINNDDVSFALDVMRAALKKHS